MVISFSSNAMDIPIGAMDIPIGIADQIYP